MALRRPALAVVLTALALAVPACRFSRNNNNALPPTSTSESTVAIFGDDTSTSIEDTTTTAVDTSTIKGAVTTRKPTTATTAKPAPKPAPTAAPAVPHCNVSAADASYGGSWTANVTSTFPNSTVVIDLSWQGGSGNYSGVTGADGSWTKTQRVNPAMRGQTIHVNASVGGRQCATSFRVS